MNSLVVMERIEKDILVVRGQKVLLDVVLARLYGVTTKRLNQQVGRNQARFPSDFCFQLTVEETQELMRLQNATASRRNVRYRPFVFTEHGSVMAASVLNTPIAVRASILVVRAFVRLRSLLAANQELAGKLGELERKIGSHDQQIRGLFDAIRQLMTPPHEPKRRIGYRAPL